MNTNVQITAEEKQNAIERSQLLIAGLNADRVNARRAYLKGSLERLANGIYLTTTLTPADRQHLVLKNATRIVKTLFPYAILDGSSAYHRGVVSDGITVATPRGGQTVDIGGVFSIYQRKSNLDLGLNNEVSMVALEDSFGENYIKRMADEVLILRNFNQRKNWPRHTYLNVIDLSKVVERAIRTAGSRAKFDNRMTSLAKSMGISHLMGKVMEFIDSTDSYVQAAKPMKSFDVYWHTKIVANMSHDGHIWNFQYAPQVGLQLSIGETKGRGAPPSFLGSLLPEVGINAGETMDDNLYAFERGHRYISNITVLPYGSSGDRAIIQDRLEGELPEFRNGHLEFSGKVDKSLSAVMEDDELMDSLQRDPNTPRMSGMQIKVAANLSIEGNLSSATDKAFTHIIKIVGSNPKYQSMCSMEWYSLTIAKACGLNVEDFAIADLNGYGPSLVVERFDIRRNFNDRRMILTEDFWSIEGLTDNRQKYAGELMNVASTLLSHSTDLGADARQLIVQSAFSWLTWNGDFHLKNLLILKEASTSSSKFDSIRLSPAYDILCTQVYPDDAKSAAIQLQGSRNHTLAGFRALGKKMGVTQNEVDSMLSFLVAAIPTWAQTIADNLPETIKAHPQSMKHIEKARELFDIRCMLMLSELDAAAKNKSRRKVAGDDGAETDVEKFELGPVGPGNGEENLMAEQRRSMAGAESYRITRPRRP